MKAFGSTRRSRDTTTENLAGSWTPTATASSCGNRCRKSSCPGHCTRASDIISFVASGLACLCGCLQAWNDLKAAGPNHSKRAGISAHPFFLSASLHRGGTYEALLFGLLLACVRSNDTTGCRAAIRKIDPASRRRRQPRNGSAGKGNRWRLDYCGEHGEE